MPKVHYIKRKVLKQHDIECVNGKFELENKTGKKSKLEMVEDTWSMGRKRNVGNQNNHGRQQKPLEINCRNVGNNSMRGIRMTTEGNKSHKK